MYNNHQYHVEMQYDSNHQLQQQQLQLQQIAMEQQQQEEELTVSNTNRMFEYASGFRFCPSDEELIMYYLLPKINGCPLPFNEIPTINISEHPPDTLKGKYIWSKLFKEEDMFIFTSRTRKYPNGVRPDRSTPTGYWKATAVEKCIKYGGKTIGYKTQLDYYTGPHQNGKRTIWKMHEYRLEKNGDAPPNNNAAAHDGKMDKQLDKCVLCKIYVNKRKKKGDGDYNGEEVSESITNAAAAASDSSQTIEETNEPLVPNQNNNMVTWGTNIAPAPVFACSSNGNINNNQSTIQKTNGGFLQNQSYNYNMVNMVPPSTSSNAFAGPSSFQMFDQNNSFRNQSLANRFQMFSQDNSMVGIGSHFNDITFSAMENYHHDQFMAASDIWNNPYINSGDTNHEVDFSNEGNLYCK